MSKLLDEAISDAIYIATNSKLPEIIEAKKVWVGILKIARLHDGSPCDVQFKITLDRGSDEAWRYVEHDRNIPKNRLSIIGETSPRIEVIE